VVARGRKAPLDQKEYLRRIAAARYGLCVRGYGPKCHREVELMAFGTVPVVLPGVDIDGYAEPPREGVHFLRADSPEAFLAVTQAHDHERWLQMSRACRRWYARNVSPSGSLRRTLAAALAGPNSRLEDVEGFEPMAGELPNTEPSLAEPREVGVCSGEPPIEAAAEGQEAAAEGQEMAAGGQEMAAGGQEMAAEGQEMAAGGQEAAADGQEAASDAFVASAR
jgi:hypothetical protein